MQDTIKGTQCYRCLITVRKPPSNHVIDGSVLNMAFGKNKAGGDRLNSVMGTTRAGYCHMFLTFNKMRPETVLNAVKCYHTVPLTAVKMDYRSGYESGDGDEIYVKKKDDGSGNPSMDIERTVTYGIIIQDKENASKNFFKWQSPCASSSSSTTKIRRLLETDSDFPTKKVHSSIHSTDALLSVLGRIQNCSESRNISPIYSQIEIQASKKHPLLIEQLFHPELLAEIEKWDLIEQTLKEDHNEDEYEPACEGSVYFASTPTLPGILKIGGTKFDGATRVQQLYTAGVPERYTCRFEFRCSDWKLFEGVIHYITKASRLYKRKEFFVMQPEAAAKLIDQINGLIPMTYDEQSEWDAAFKKITVRLEKSRAKWAKKQSKRPREDDWKAGPSWAQTTAAMDNLVKEVASLRAQLRTRPTEST